MLKTISICDKCGHEEVTEGVYTNNNFTSIRIEIGTYNRTYRNYLLCKECQKELGFLTVDEKGKENEEHIKTIEERLFDLIGEIVAEVQQ